MGRKLKRSKHDKVLAGVCGGVAEYLNLDSTIIRLGFVLLTFFGGVGPIAYIVGVFIMPQQESYKPNNFFDEDKDNIGAEYDSEKDFTQVMGDSMDTGSQDSQRSGAFVGVSLILLGLMFLAKQFIPAINFTQLVPVLLIVIGIFIVFRNGRK
ncbi:PspC domain-containing protein [Acetivibrio cellulolyticus]|uniref:PspC domain-containing protein n=1 Tax=Acetivibrio cellulolyticus TaxID=35830 RepID=UPI0001E2E76A|nr:PspC domain-containing protein [Acetivibrio cellulolyticus]